jgi:hypothetical protein
MTSSGRIATQEVNIATHVTTSRGRIATHDVSIATHVTSHGRIATQEVSIATHVMTSRGRIATHDVSIATHATTPSALHGAVRANTEAFSSTLRQERDVKCKQSALVTEAREPKSTLTAQYFMYFLQNINYKIVV